MPRDPQSIFGTLSVANPPEPNPRAPQSVAGTLVVENPPESNPPASLGGLRWRRLFPSPAAEPSRPLIRSKAALRQPPSAVSGAVDMFDWELLQVLVALEF
jgi:hypothetical protein